MKPQSSVALLASLTLTLGCQLDPVYVGRAIDKTGDELCGADPKSSERGRCFIDSLLPSNIAARFAKPTDEARKAPEVVYPVSGSMHAPNVDLLSIHFTPRYADEDAFELSLIDATANAPSRVLYFPCLSTGQGGCVYQLPEAFLREAWNAFRGHTVRARLRAVAGNKPPGLAREVTLAIAPEAVRGGLFYWSAELRGLYRLLFGAREAVPFIKPRTAENPDACAGCHSVSRDGTTVSFTRGKAEEATDIYKNAAFDGHLTVANVLTPESPRISHLDSDPSDSAMMALSSDGSRVVTAFNYIFSLRDSTTNAVLDEYLGDGKKQPFFPEYSPTDGQLALTLSANSDSEIAVRSGSIALLTLTKDSFGEVRELVPESKDEAHFYPTWSPDGEWIAFVTGPGTKALEDKSYDQKSSRLRLVRVSTGAVVELGKASNPLDRGATWPKFAPFLQCKSGGLNCDVSERLYFLTFNSRRDYGLLHVKSSSTPLASQLWTTAIDAGLALAGKDPSLPAVWLPYQSLGTSNHLGLWTEVLRCSDRMPCGPFEECSGKGECTPVIR